MKIPGTLQQRLQVSAALIGVGLLVQAGTLFSSRPTAFLSFILVGGSLVGVGILIYLLSLVTD